MKYVTKKKQKQASARTGTLSYKEKITTLPKIGLTLRTKTDCNVISELMIQGQKIDWINPLASHTKVLHNYLNNLTYKKGSVSIKYRPIVIADPESEALSQNTVARKNFILTGSYSAPIKLLFDSGLSQCHNTWRNIIKSYGYTQLTNWAVSSQRSVMSDFFFSTPPIIRLYTDTIDLASEISTEMILKATNIGIFDNYAHHFLLHPEIFKDTQESKKSIGHLQKTIQDLVRDEKLPKGCSFSFKLLDDDCLTISSEAGPINRQNFSYFFQEIGQIIQNSGDQKVIDEESKEITDNRLLMFHNSRLGWALGLLDSGVDIVTTRISGKPIIERPHGGGVSGPRIPPAPWDHSKLAEGSTDLFKLRWEKESAFTTPPGVNPEPWWTGKYGEQVKYVSKLKAASALSLCEEYIKTLLDEEKNLKDELLNRVKQSDVKELMDLCPSLW